VDIKGEPVPVVKHYATITYRGHGSAAPTVVDGDERISFILALQFGHRYRLYTEVQAPLRLIVFTSTDEGSHLQCDRAAATCQANSLYGCLYLLFCLFRLLLSPISFFSPYISHVSSSTSVSISFFIPPPFFSFNLF
jgi:hypothetical protein